MKEIFIGIDVSQEKNNICIINDPQSKSLLEYELPNTKNGSKKLISLIASIKQHYTTIKDIHIAVESTGIYSKHILSYLSNNMKYTVVNVHIYCLNPYAVKSYKTQKMQFSKNDYIDARTIAEYICIYHPFLYEYNNIGFKILRELTSQRMSYSKEISRLKFRLIQLVFKRYNYLAVKRSKGEVSKTILNNIAISDFLIEFPDIQELAQLSKMEIIQLFLNRYGSMQGIGKRCARESAIIIFDAIRFSFRQCKTSTDIVTLSIVQTYTLMQTYKKQQDILDKAIERITKNIDDTAMKILMSIPGIGPVFASGILSELGDISLYKSNASLAKYSGLIWLEDQSGPRKGKKVLASVCNRKLRLYICMATKRIINESKFYKDYYEKKKAEVKVNSSKRALILTARKVVKLIYALLKDNKLYSPNVMKRNIAFSKGVKSNRVSHTKLKSLDVSLNDLIKLNAEDFKSIRESRKQINKIKNEKFMDGIKNEFLNISELNEKSFNKVDMLLDNDKELNKTIDNINEQEIENKEKLAERDEMIKSKYAAILLPDTKENDLLKNQKEFDDSVILENDEEVDEMMGKILKIHKPKKKK